MGLLAVKVTDDRGRRVALLTIDDLRDPANRWRWADAESGELATRLRVVSASQPRKRVWPLVLMIFVFTGGAVAVVIGLAASGWISRGMLPAVGPVTGLMVGLLSREWRRRGSAGEQLRTILMRRRCGSCGYALAGCEVEPDRCVRCPECAAAWSVDRMDAGGEQTGSRLGRAPPAPEGGARAGVLPISVRVWTRWTYVADASGLRVPIANYRLRGAMATAGEEGAGRRERVEAARRELRPGVGRWASVVLSAVAVIALVGMQLRTSLPSLSSVMASSPGAWTWSRAGSLAWPVAAVVFWVGLGLIWLGFLGSRGLSPRAVRVKEVMLGHDLCPSCAADLPGRADDPPGDRVCATCGAKWGRGKQAGGTVNSG